MQWHYICRGSSPWTCPWTAMAQLLSMPPSLHWSGLVSRSRQKVGEPRGLCVVNSMTAYPEQQLSPNRAVYNPVVQSLDHFDWILHICPQSFYIFRVNSTVYGSWVVLIAEISFDYHLVLFFQPGYTRLPTGMFCSQSVKIVLRLIWMCAGL